MTTTPTLTLTAFLEARIAEDEAEARECAEAFPSPWEVADRGWRVRIYAADLPDIGDHAEPGDVRVPCVIEVEPTQHHRELNEGGWLSDRVAHIARHDPARVLAECEAKRRIIEWHKSWPVLVEGPPEFTSDTGDDIHTRTMRMTRQIAWTTEQQYRERFGSEPPTGPILRALAAVYSDHPDYNPGWA